MTRLKCIAIDDEPFALEMLADDIGQVDFLELVATFSNPVSSVSLLSEGMIDLIFLDIQMPTLTGIQFLKNLQKPPMVIFITAYQQYALEGYELNIIDYLLKPVPFQRFLKACEKAQELFLLRQKDIVTPPEHEQNFFFIFSEYKQIKLFFDTILYIEGMKDYVKIYTTQQTRPILTRLNLKAIEAKLPVSQFCRVHQSFIVALGKITAFQKSKIQISQTQIPVGSRFLSQFEEQYRKPN
ncbi:MAG: LytR/AlgR family response regulator transcription factor [Runella zeae]